MIGEKLKDQVKHYLMEIRKRGGVVNAAIALAVGKGIVRNGDLPYKDVELTKSHSLLIYLIQVRTITSVFGS